MSDIVVKGMEMPNRCAKCILCDLRYGTKCKVTGEIYYNSKGYARGGYDGKPDWCPLVELPEKHGRLIDADALIARRGNLAVDSENIVELSEGWTIPLESVIDIEPTIVEAEGEEDKE